MWFVFDCVEDVFGYYLLVEMVMFVKFYEVMCYVVFGGGKCVCLLLCYVVGELIGVMEVVCNVVVVVLEMIYVYLFVYDDMLCMDDDVLCCGKLIVYV